MNELISIVIRQGGAVLPLRVEYDKMIWSGLSWAAGELRRESYDASAPVEIECSSTDRSSSRSSSARIAREADGAERGSSAGRGGIPAR